MQAAGASTSGPNIGRAQLAQLVQQIGDILAQGEDSGTPSQHTEFRTKLRSVLLRLLDLGVSSTSATSRELAAVLQLLKLTLEKVPHWLTGDTNTLLLEILERLVPMLVRPIEGRAWTDLIDIIGRILLRIAETEQKQFIALVDTFCKLFSDAYSVAIALSLDPGNAATVQCSIASINAADSSHRPLSLPLNNSTAVEHVLQATLKSLAEAMAPRPSTSALLIPDTILQGACCLLSCNSVALQAAALQLITAVVRGQPRVPQPLHCLPDRLRMMVHTAHGQLAASEDNNAREEWIWRFTALLQALSEQAAVGEDMAPHGVSNQAVIQMAVAAADFLPSEACGLLCELIAELILRDPLLLENCTGVLRVLPKCPPSARRALLEALCVYLSTVPAQQAQQALNAAMEATGNHAGDPHAIGLQGNANNGGLSNQHHEETAAPSKRQRINRPIPESEEQEGFWPMAVDEALPPGLAAVACAVHAVVHDLQVQIMESTQLGLSPEGITQALVALADLVNALGSIAPAINARWAVESVKKWAGWGALQFGGRGLPEDQVHAGLNLLSSGLQAVLSCNLEERSKISGLDVVTSGLNQSLLACVRGEGPGAAGALAVALLASQLEANSQHQGPGAAFVECFEAARGKYSGTQAARAALLPAAACLAVPPPLNSSGKVKSKQTTPPAINPLKGLLLRTAKSQEPEVVAALIRGMHAVAEMPDNHAMMIQHAVRAASTGLYYPVEEVSNQMGASSSQSKSLSPSLCDWMRPVLILLCSEESAPSVAAAKASPALVNLVAIFLEHAPISEVEQSKDLAQWLLAQAGSSDAAVRGAVLRHARLLASPQMVLTLHHEGAHPTVPRDRRAAADKFEHEVIVALKARIPEPITDVARAEDILQLIGHVGWCMRSSRARMLTLAILVLALEQRDAAVSATAAECLRGFAAAQKCSVKELIFSTPRLIEQVGQQLPHKPDLLHELADLIGVSPRTLAISVLPRVLPQLAAKTDRAALEALAQQAGITARQMMMDHGHHALAASLLQGCPSMDDLIPLAEEMTGQDFMILARALLPKTVTEMVVQTGAAQEWGPSGSGALPEEAVQQTSKMLALLASTTSAQGDNEGARVNTSEFLAEGDHVTRMLKEFGDELEKRLAAPQTDRKGQTKAPVAAPVEIAATLGVLRRILVLVRLTGPFVGRFLPQFMVLLGAAVRPGNHKEIKLQGLVGWQLLVKALSNEAPVQLGGIVNQVVVALLDGLQEGALVGAAAARVVEELIAACRVHYPEKIRSMPPLPQRMLELRHVNGLLQEARGSLTTEQQVEVLLESLTDEALSVRSTALQELRVVLASRRDWVATLKSNHGLQMRLLGALLKASEPGANSSASFAAQQACAECLGMLGAIDPATVKLDPKVQEQRCATDAQLAVELLTKHLVRLLKTAPNLQCLDATTLAIQKVLRAHAATPELREKYREAQGAAAEKAQVAQTARRTPGGTKQRQRSATPQAEANALFCVLPAEVQAIVRPYLDSKFQYRATGKKIEGVIFKSGLSFRRWLAVWLTQLIDQHVSGDALPLFDAVKPVLRHDIHTAMFIAPYAILNAVLHGNRPALDSITAELLAVLKAEGSSRDTVLCMQAVFHLLDVLQRWYEEYKSAITSAASAATTTTISTTTTIEGDGNSNDARGAGDMGDWVKVWSLLSAIPKNTVARAAAACGAHARALLHYETYLRATRGGGANPASFQPTPSYADAEVTFLLEVYSKLEEPDGLDGLMKLRQGGPRPEDQRVAAEKAGSWGEALTLYERDLARQEWPQLGALSAAAGGGRAPAQPSTSAAAAAAGTKSPAGSTVDEKARSASQRGYLNCLLQMGHWQGLLTQVEGMGALLGTSANAAEEAPRLAAMGAAAAWRLGRWDNLDRYLSSAERGFAVLSPDEMWEARIGGLLRTAATADDGTAAAAIAAQLEVAKSEVMGPFSAAAMESYSRAYSHLVKLHMLQEVADAAAMIGHGPKERRRTLRWEERLALTQSSLATQGPILALRRQLAALSRASDDAGNCWLQHAQLCRSTGHLDAAVPAVLEATAAGIPGATFERVQLLYARGEHHRAMSELRILENQLAEGGGDGVRLNSETERSRYRAQVLLRLAEWTAETGQGTREEVSGLFENALALRDNWDTGLFKYAAYLDELMLDARARQQEAGEMITGTDRLGGKSRIKLGEDRPHLAFLPEVMRNYGRSVQAGSRHIYRSLPRLLTLWFEFGAVAAVSRDGSAERSAVPVVMNIMKGFAKSIPTHCWLITLPQLISRICHRHPEVAATTRHIVTQTASIYPQQALWQLAAVSKSSVAARRSAANSIISGAKKAAKGDDEKKIFTENGGLCEQLIKLCHFTPQSNKKVLSARRDLMLNSLLRTMPLGVMIPIMSALTPSLPPAGSGHSTAAERGWRPFGDPVTIAGMKDEVDVMTSLQRPKRIVLIGSDGIEYPFLAKPKDDLRKDCRMMEAAGVVNKVFEEDSATRRRNLYLRRFAVVPITEDCGLVEWVNHTKPIRNCINDMYDSPQDVRAMHAVVKAWYEKATKTGTLVKWLEQTVNAYPPRLHKWFLAKWAEPAAWLNARLNFTRTYAVWCMVGHIAGLGDRHGENILLDMQSGDTIQIDFGCLFDKGLTLAIPEVVPFRLTQNAIDSFGVFGIEGVFRRSCEATLSVLRGHRGTILSVMDTFVHDPLVEWARDEKKLRTAGAVAETENPQAKDAMATIEGRLKGTLLGVSSRPCMPLSVEGHVHMLLQEATTKDNLSRMYIWWQAWA